MNYSPQSGVSNFPTIFNPVEVDRSGGHVGLGEADVLHVGGVEADGVVALLVKDDAAADAEACVETFV